jgi:hypothetical protein
MSGQSHHISTAGKIRVGDFQSPYDQSPPGKGISVCFLHRYVATPAIGDADGYSVAAAVAAAGNLTLGGALCTNGVGIADVARNVVITGTDAGDTTQTATVYGSDIHGQAQVETIAFNGAAAIQGKKAFKTVTRIAISAALTGTAAAGTGDILGLPVAVRTVDVLQKNFDGSTDAGTLVAGVTTTPATAITGDPKGTYDPAGTLDGAKILDILMVVRDLNNPFGVANYAG